MLAEVQHRPSSPACAHPLSQVPPALKGEERDRALDIVKGLLVVLMALYHGINYTAYLALAFKWLGFLPPAFIFITGFLLAIVYTRKYDLKKTDVYARLAIRGLKLVVLFTAMNLMVYLLRSRGQDSLPSTLLSFFGHWQQVYLSGSGRVAVFEVLLPIAYFLLCAPILILAYRKSPPLIPISFVVVASLCVLLERTGRLPDNFSLWSAGLLGMSVGLLNEARVRSISRSLSLGLVAYLAYRACGYIFGVTYLIQMFGVMAALLLCYGVALRLPSGVLSASLTLMGKYSLLAYIAQIVFLQGYSAIFGRNSESAVFALFLFLAVVLVSASAAYLTDFLRRCSSIINRSYQAIFP